MVDIPEFAVPLTNKDGRIEKSWYQALATLFKAAATLTNATGSAGTMPGNYTAAAAPDTRKTNTAVKSWLAIAASDVSGLAAIATTPTYANLTGTWTFTDAQSLIISVPANGDLSPGVIMPWAGTLTKLYGQSASGTCTLTLKKNGTAVTGISNAISTTQTNSTATAGNVFALGDLLTPNIASNSACTNLSMTAIFTRTLP